MHLVDESFGSAWYSLLQYLKEGERAEPRGLPTREIRGVIVDVLDTRNNILVSPARKPVYKFMVAEWLWIWFGHERVDVISQYNRHIAQFSDDGNRFNGAYGPRIVRHWPRAIKLLKDDPFTRQAVIPIFGQFHEFTGTRDMPCTLTFQMLLRRGMLHGIVNMRSSDVWLGLPYDFFTFSQLLNIAAAQLNVELGSMRFHLGSSHIYESDLLKGETVRGAGTLASPVLKSSPPQDLNRVLVTGKWSEAVPLNRPWSHYADVLRCDSQIEAYDCLCKATLQG